MLFDLLYFVLLLVYVIKGYKKGAIIAVFSAIALIIGIIGSLKLANVVAVILFEGNEKYAKWALLISYVLIFVVLVVLIRSVGKIIEKGIQLLALGFINRLLGMIAYAFLVTFAFSCFLWILTNLDILSTQSNQSIILPILLPFAMKIYEMIGSILPFVMVVIENLKDFFETLNHKLPDYVDTYR